jgi:glycosyltransferase involved in cell wall biosynthesis
MRHTETSKRKPLLNDFQSRPKVLLLITKGLNGGAQTHTLALCQSLSTQVNFSVAIGGPEHASVLRQGLSVLDVPVYSIPQLSNSLSPIRLLLAIRNCVHLIRLYRPDIIHAHSTAAGAIARIAGVLANVPVIYTVHGFGFKPEVPLLQRSMVWLTEFSLARLTTRMICVSNFEREMATALPLLEGRIATIANALPDSGERSNQASADLSIVMVARFDAPKRQDILIQALAVLRNQLGHELHTFFIGDGPTLANCQALARKLALHDVAFVGDVNDVPSHLAGHSVFVLASDHEGMPISIIEAMRAGLAIVASDLPGISELVERGKSGLLVPNQTLSFAAALMRLSASPSLRQSLGHAARLRYETHYRQENAARAVLQLYEEVLK